MGEHGAKIASVRTAIITYYDKPYINNKDIMALFDCGATKAQRLKARAKEEQIKAGIPMYDASSVNTSAAYIAWGLDIHDLEERYKKLMKYGVRDAK